MKTIITDYPDLEKFPIKETFGYVEPPIEMVELLKEYILVHCCIGTVWNRDKVKEFEQTQKLKERCKQLRTRILECDWKGNLTFNLNGEVVVVWIFFDEEDESKTIEFEASTLIEYEYELK